jgi:glycosyltransferase involved in cell wall biosynthesis
MPDDVKILYVTTALFSPPHIGCMQRAVNIARQLKRCGTVTMLAVSPRFDPASVELCSREFPRFEQVRLKAYADYPEPWDKVLLKFHMHWPTNCGIRASRADQSRFAALVSQHDIVWFNTLGAQTPFDVPPAEKTVIDLDDLNHCKYDQSSQCQPSLRFRLSAKVQSLKWKRLERNALKRSGAVVVCSEQDKAFLGGGSTLHVVPNGFPAPRQKPEPQTPDPLRLGFIGQLAYGPNRDGLIWFRDQVWPQIRKEKPHMRLRVVGRTPPDRDAVQAEGFEYLGYVEDPTEEMQTWSATVVPIPYGGGTRIKILDAFSKLCPVISTTIGAHGIQVTHEENILLADAPADFARHCLRLSGDADKGKQLAEEGWKLFCAKYTWDVIGKSIAGVVDKFYS